MAVMMVYFMAFIQFAWMAQTNSKRIIPLLLQHDFTEGVDFLHGESQVEDVLLDFVVDGLAWEVGEDIDELVEALGMTAVCARVPAPRDLPVKVELPLIHP